MNLNLKKLILLGAYYLTMPDPVSCKRKNNLPLKDSGSCKSVTPGKNDLKFINDMNGLSLGCKKITSSPTEIKTTIIYLARLSKGEELAGLRLIKDNMAALVLKDIMKTRRHAYTVTGYEAINRFFEFLESEITKTYSNSKQHVIDQAKSEASFLRKLKKIFLQKTKLLQTNNSNIELTIRLRYQRKIHRPHVHSLYDDIDGSLVKVNGEIILGLGDPVTQFFNGNFTESSVQGSFTHSRYVDSVDSDLVKIPPGNIVGAHFCNPHQSPPLEKQSPHGGLLLTLALVEHIKPENK